jgi:putative transposase
LAEEGHHVPLSTLCRWLEVPRRTLYYRPRGRQSVVVPEKAAQVKAVIERFPTYGYRRIAVILGWNRKVVQRICQRRGWQVRKRAKGHRPRVKALPSVAPKPNQRSATDLAMVWCGRDRWCHLAAVIDCGSRELLGWRLSRRGNARTAEAALEEALIERFGHLGRVLQPLQLRSDNGLVFTSKQYTSTVAAYGLAQEFITPYWPEQNGMIERFFRSMKEECVWQHRFESVSHARDMIGRWMRHYNTERPHQGVGTRCLRS